MGQGMRGRPYFYFAYGVAVSEVAIDTLTGESRLLRADILHDVGKSLNPAMDRTTLEAAAEAQKPLIATEETKARGLGSMDPARWTTLSKQLAELKIIERPLPAAEVMAPPTALP